jgi:hypothetical protein
MINDDIINNTMSITNREDLKEKIHDIHNYMRNNGIGYGLNSLKTFNVLYGLKKIQDYNLFEKVGLTKEECKFNYLLKLANDNSNKTIEVLKEIVLQELYDNEILKDLLIVEFAVQIIEFAFYIWLIYYFNKVSKNITPFRYLDWMITTPLMLITLSAFLYHNDKMPIRLIEFLSI